MDEAEALYEQVLVLRCQTGDPAAFTELVARYGPRLAYFLRKMLPGGATAAEDALQDVWLDVHRHLPRLADPKAFRAWVYRVARNRALRDLRRHPLQPLPPDPDALPDPAAGDDDAFGPEDAAAVHRALDRLHPDHREALLLRFVEDMTYEQIAAVTGCAVGTVRSRLYYAKRALKREIQPEVPL